MILTKWLGTFLCLLGIALTSYNVYPLNILFGFLGSALWALVGFLQRDPPLFLVEFVAVVLYLSGLIVYVFHQLITWGVI